MGKLTIMRALALAAPSFAACAPAVPAVHAQEAVIRVESDPGTPVAGAKVTFDGRTLAETSNEGRARRRMTGHDGDVFHIAVGCPEGFEPASELAFDVLVRHGLDAGRAPEFVGRCARAERRAIVVVRATNGPNLPVLYLGREVARTDASGAATLGLDVHPGDDVELTLDTRGAKKPHPQNPALSFKAPERNDLVMLDQKFTVEKTIVRVVHRRPSIPRALGGG
jgi:hypothetical protein